MSLQSPMPPLQQAAQQAQAAAQRAQAAAVQRARDTLDLCTMYSLQAQAAAKKAKVAAVQHARDGLAITTTTVHKALWACQRVLKEGCTCTRRSKALEPEAGLYSEETISLPTAVHIETIDLAKSEPPGANKAAADEDDLGPIRRARQSVFEFFAMPKGFREEMLAKTHHEAAHVAANEDEDELGRARKSVFESFAMPKLREEVLAKRPDLLVHEATHAAADEDEPATPVGRARNSVFETFAMPNLRNEVAAKVTHEAKESAPDGDRYSDGMIRMGTERKSIFQNFAIDMPSLRGEVAAKKAQPAKRTRADKNSVYSGAPVRKDPTPALALTLPLTLAPNLALLSTPTTNQASPSRSLTLTLTRS